MEPSRDHTARDRPMSESDPNSCLPSGGGELYITVVYTPVRSMETSRVSVQDILGSWMKEGTEETQRVFMPKYLTQWIRSTWVHVLLLVFVIPAPHSQSCPVLFSNNFPFFWICFPLESIIAHSCPRSESKWKILRQFFLTLSAATLLPSPQRTHLTTDKGRPLCLSLVETNGIFKGYIS